jgi:hypothetical protein
MVCPLCRKPSKSAHNSKKDVNIWPVSSLSSADCSVVAVELEWGLNKSKRTAYLASVYADILIDPITSYEKVISTVISTEIPLLIGTDANAHSPMWGGKENPRGKALEEYFVMNEITCMNVGSSPTFQQGDKSSIIDLTLINKHASWIAVQEWQVEEGSLSDHKIISYRINDYDPYKQSFRNYKKVEWGRYKYLQQQLTELMYTVEQEQKERVQALRGLAAPREKPHSTPWESSKRKSS